MAPFATPVSETGLIQKRYDFSQFGRHESMVSK